MRALPSFHLFSASSRVNIFTFRIRIKDDYFLVQRKMFWLLPLGGILFPSILIQMIVALCNGLQKWEKGSNVWPASCIFLEG